MTEFSAEVEGVVRRLRDGMAGGVLSFPLTSFREDGELDLESYRAYLTAQLATAPGAVFPACGTGEFSALDEDEYRAVIEATVEIADGRLPVVAGIGYGWAQALRFARIAETAGADAALVLPHYLVEAPQDGLVEQLRRIAAGTRLPLIAYQRGPVAFTPDGLRRIAEIPTVIGLKDGHSDLDRLQRLTPPRTASCSSTAPPPPRSRPARTPPSASPPTRRPCTPSRPRSRTPASPLCGTATTPP